MTIPCTCGCGRLFPASQIHDMRVKSRRSKACIKRLRAEPKFSQRYERRELSWMVRTAIGGGR